MYAHTCTCGNMRILKLGVFIYGWSLVIVRQDLSPNVELTDWLDWLAMKPMESSSFYLPLQGLQMCAIMAGSSVGAENLKPDPHTSMTSILPIEPFPEALEYLLYSLFEKRGQSLFVQSLIKRSN